MITAEAFRERVQKQLKARQDDPYYEIRQQIGVLEQDIAAKMAEYRTRAHELTAMKRAVAEFVADYCLEVGELAERLHALDARLRDAPIKPLPVREGTLAESLPFTFTPPMTPELSAGEVKRLYRQLAKVVHPDAAPENPRAAEMFALLNASYVSKDIPTLEYLKAEFLGEDETGHDLPEENPVQKVERLEQEHTALCNMLDRVLLEENALKTSEGYRLYQQVCWHKMCGEDLVESIRARMKFDIRRKELVLAGLEHASA